VSLQILGRQDKRAAPHASARRQAQDRLGGQPGRLFGGTDATLLDDFADSFPD